MGHPISNGDTDKKTSKPGSALKDSIQAGGISAVGLGDTPPILKEFTDNFYDKQKGWI